MGEITRPFPERHPPERAKHPLSPAHVATKPSGWGAALGRGTWSSRLNGIGSLWISTCWRAEPAPLDSALRAGNQGADSYTSGACRRRRCASNGLESTAWFDEASVNARSVVDRISPGQRTWNPFICGVELQGTKGVVLYAMPKHPRRRTRRLKGGRDSVW